jgi:hypothetical protein
MVAERTPETIGRGRPSNAQLTGRLGRAREVNGLLRTENHSLLAEVARLGAELIAIGSRIDMALTADRPDLALHFAGRIDQLGRSCQRRGGVA